MNRNTAKMVLGLMACTVILSCGKKKTTDDIIAPKPVRQVQTSPIKLDSRQQSVKVEWLGRTYQVSISRKPDTNLSLSKDERGRKYYDNAIAVRITRADGSEFFNRTFTKTDFSQHISEGYLRDGALLGIVLDHAEGDNLLFAASVGSPDVLSDDYIPLVLTVTRMGAVSIVRDTKLDTYSPDDDDDEGV